MYNSYPIGTLLTLHNVKMQQIRLQKDRISRYAANNVSHQFTSGNGSADPDSDVEMDGINYAGDDSNSTADESYADPDSDAEMDADPDYDVDKDAADDNETDSGSDSDAENCSDDDSSSGESADENSDVDRDIYRSYSSDDESESGE